MKTLFICRSNAARSQIGEAWFNHFTDSANGFSAGTAAGDFKVVPYDVRAVMLDAGIEIPAGALPKQLTPEMTQVAGRIILMTGFRVPDYLIDNPKVTIWDVIDPRHSTDSYGIAEASDKIRGLIKEQLL